MKKLMIFLIRLYQKFISPAKGSQSCRFLPTCSQYAIEAIEEWGAVIGLVLAVRRLLRCNPFCRGGFDPVPKNNRKKKYSKSTEIQEHSCCAHTKDAEEHDDEKE